jgi:hypothetical protein
MTGLRLLIYLLLFTVAAVPATVLIAAKSSSAGVVSSGSKNVAVPGPVAGAGLPAIAVVGGYIWLVRRKRRDTVRKPAE